MHRIVARRTPVQALYLRCYRTAVIENAAGSVIAQGGRRAFEVPSHQTTTTRRRRGYHTPSPAVSTFGSHHDTIYALSSAHGKAGIAVIRISGPSCTQIYHALCPRKKAPKPRYATLRTLFLPGTQAAEVLDPSALVLYFPAPQTVTGEDVLELHVHGGSATVKAVLSAIATCTSGDGPVRYAEPGEFTRRAFANDRLDLAQVEALSETLAAETEQQRRAAVRGSSGSLGRTYEDWRRRLLAARAEMEALIDFQEDQHFDESPAALVGNVSRQVEDILRSIRVHESAGQRTELLRNGIQVALLGPPNAGKSSLMNLVVGREASIVSGESGTTRDIVEAHLDIRGYLCTFADTAGFRTATNATTTSGPPINATHHHPETKIGAVEEEGIRRARERAAQSDVIIVLASVEEDTAAATAAAAAATVRDAVGGYEIRHDLETLQLAAACPQRLVLINKTDSVPQAHLGPLVHKFRQEVLRGVPGLGDITPTLVSCKEAQDQSSDRPDPGGVRAVADQLALAFQNMTSLPANLQDLHGVTERQRQLLMQCRHSLEEYGEVAGTVTGAGDEGEGEGEGEEGARDIDLTMAAEHLRSAASSLGRITGRGEAGDVEEILGVIFEKFCVGK
ncbi:putative tRNA modification GTPase [Rosellinia necatrix]|uniref:Putative tRNA modification GTPase n=1 Tax=Rosellinia necatrix TaxID=77044 RepID=A0A1W2TT49_ROSNE|nr:putative tRNA modification GTPase [Rosellinia necatrix]